MAENIIRLAACNTSRWDGVHAEGKIRNLMTPGDFIAADTEFMRGHGTYAENSELRASVAGLIKRVDKLVSVQPVKSRYSGEIGDVVVGRIIDLGQKRWKVETKSKLDSVLLLSSVNLPGGELRRRGEEDEREMRGYLSEGDLVSAEVQSVFFDGSLSLHTRSLKYGKLDQGVLVDVAPSLIKRRKTHFHNLPCGASIILGNNGYIWISTTINENDGENQTASGGFIPSDKPVTDADREVIGRLRNCILALAEHRVLLYDTTIHFAYEASTSSSYKVKDLLKPEVMKEIVDVVKQRLELET